MRLCRNKVKDHEAFIYRLQELEGQGFPTERLLTAAVGMSAEAGEFTEVVKKIIFQGKPVNEDNLFHLKRELGDIMWYVAQACIGLDISSMRFFMNVDKLSDRYPDGLLMYTIPRNRQKVMSDGSTNLQFYRSMEDVGKYSAKEYSPTIKFTMVNLVIYMKK